MPSTNTINKATTLCVSLAARPSNMGTRFHNYLYDALGLDYLYKAFAPADIESAVAGIRGLGIRGAGVSMPYKQVPLCVKDAVSARWSVRRCLSPSRSFVRLGAPP